MKIKINYDIFNKIPWVKLVWSAIINPKVLFIRLYRYCSSVFNEFLLIQKSALLPYPLIIVVRVLLGVILYMF